MLTAHLQLVLELRTSGAAPPLPLYVFTVCTDTTVPFAFFSEAET